MQYKNPYYDLFFKSPLSFVNSPEFQERIPKDLKQNVHSYTDKNPSPILNNEVLNNWYHHEGQAILITVFEKLWNILSNLSQNAMPSHDARHAIFKVPACVLELIDSEQVSGWETVGVLGGLMHDWGRWSEERIYGRPQGGAIHSRMSFLLSKEFLEDFDIPKEIKWHILEAVKVHTKGGNEDSPMVTKLTVAA
ncbi:MAG: hypothetical protein H7263_00200, partial [Candidatus Sericytochromatia bacterium]|nr:hypothetical protein [Candidatus Sericytochromatia bacterium]